MDETHVVTCFLRHDAAVLLLRRSDEVGSYAGRWGTVAGHAEGDPARASREVIREETGLDPETDVELVREGKPFAVEDPDVGVRWNVHPFLFDAGTRAIEPNRETAEWEWVSPTAILRRETVPDLWTSYDRVRPTVNTVAGDRERGSASLSIRALEVLRDEAALADLRRARDDRYDEGSANEGGWRAVTEVAADLIDARPSMAVIRNRVNRAMADATAAGTPASVVAAADDAIEAALAADDRAADAATDRIEGKRIATLSRSGTVARALRVGDPDAVLVAESRPGGEGVAVAESLGAEGFDVTLTSDAALAFELASWDAEVLLVGADAIHADGSVRNKVGTRGAATAATHEGVDVLVVASVDKVDPEASTGDVDVLEPRDPSELYDGPAAVAVANPTFDVTPPALVDAIATDDGLCDVSAVEGIAAEHADRADWRSVDG